MTNLDNSRAVRPSGKRDSNTRMCLSCFSLTAKKEHEQETFQSGNNRYRSMHWDGSQVY